MKNICILIFIFFICSCTKNQEIEDDFKDSILVQIGNHIILKDELIQRSEYVIRPNYCSKNNNIHKQIILNSLIAEKLLAIEGKEAFNNVPINNYLKGLKEQSMREKLFFSKTKLLEKIDKSELNKFRKTADRIYNLSFINLTRTQAKAIVEEINISSESTNNLFNAVLNIFKAAISDVFVILTRKYSEPIGNNSGSYIFKCGSLLSTI